MTDKPVTGLTASWVRAMAQARGLDRAYVLYPEIVAAAAVRGTDSLSSMPKEFSAVTEPAITFDPAKSGEGA